MSPLDTVTGETTQRSLAEADLLALILSCIAAAAPSAMDLASPLAAGDLAFALHELRRRPRPGDLPLVALADALALEDAELVALALAAAVETDPTLCRTLAAVQAPIGGSRPLLGLLATALAPLQPTAATVLSMAQGTAVRCGLLRLDGPDVPLPERSIAFHLPTLAALAGYGADWEQVHLLPPRPAIALPSTYQDAASGWAVALAARAGAALVIRAADEAEGRALAQLVAAAAGRRVAWLPGPPPAGLAPWLVAAAAIPVFAGRMRSGEERVLPSLIPYAGPIIAVCGHEGAVTMTDGAPGHWVVTPPDGATRAALWRGGGVAEDAAVRAAETFRHGAARIASLAAAAQVAAGAAADWQAVQRAVAAQGVPGLEALTAREPASANAVKLVVPAALRSALAHLLDRCRLRDRLAGRLGPAVQARHSPGVRALFHGASGTGKSLAAHWLAAELGMPLHRVDLAALTSKWIGETEKNLSDLLGTAEHADVVLLFDEADALFGARTEVSDAHDRHANAQTNYLLQRMERFSGIAIMTSNGRDRFDAAFTRRLDVILEFPLPDAPARRALWRAHLGEPGDGHALDGTQVDRLAHGLDLAGGHIRNIVLAAAVTAQAQGRPIAWDDVAAGAAAEYAKLGRTLPAGRMSG